MSMDEWVVRSVLSNMAVEGLFIVPMIAMRLLTLSQPSLSRNIAIGTLIYRAVGAFLSVPFLILGLVIVRNLFVEDGGELPA
jgi:hypothetical protein